MEETRKLVDALKRCLKMRGLTYRELAERIGLSEASVKRLFSQRSFTLRRLEQVCAALEISLVELARMTETQTPGATTLSLQQEQALARDPALLSYFYLLLNGWTEPDIQRNYEFAEAQLQRLRRKLLDLGLLELRRGGRHRLTVGRQILWRRDGPVRKTYERQVKAEFLQSDFAGQGDFFGWQPAELSPASIEVLRRRLARLHQEFLEMAELDSLSTGRRRSTALLLAFRPWTFSLVAVRRRKGGPMWSASARAGGRGKSTR